MSIATPAPRAASHLSRRTSARTGFVALVVTDALGMIAAAAMVVAPFTVLNEPRFRAGEAEMLIRGWGLTWLALSVVCLTILLTAFRRAETWAWTAMAVLPLLWLSHFILAPDTVHNLVLAVVSAAGLAATRPGSSGAAASSRVAETRHSG